MRIAFDLDGVLADLHRAFAAAALQLFPGLDASAISSPQAGASPPTGVPGAEAPGEPEEASLIKPLSPRKQSAVWQHLATVENFWETLEEIESGAIRRLAAIALERKWEVIFLTSRPYAPGFTVQRQSQMWLDRMGFPMPSLYVVQTSRGKIAEALEIDVVVDDRPENCLDVALESKARAILVWRGAPEKVPPATRRLGIGVVHTVAGCLDLLIKADEEAQTPEDLVQRLRRLLGLMPKTKA
jgi:hypothetical protein